MHRVQQDRSAILTRYLTRLKPSLNHIAQNRSIFCRKTRQHKNKRTKQNRTKRLKLRIALNRGTFSCDTHRSQPVAGCSMWVSDQQ